MAIMCQLLIKVMIVNKSELVSALSKACKINQSMAGKFLDAMIKIVVAAILKLEKVGIVGFGTFKVVKVKERMVRNPRTGVKMRIPARFKLKFSPSKNVQALLNKKK